MSASNEDKSITYQYDANGLRYKKTVDGVEYTYYYMGDKLVRLTIGDTTIMDFTYDQNGQPYAMIYNGTKLYYVLNQQGDVVRLVNSSGKSYGVYRYDAWGNILYVSDNQYTNSNPLRYRGYVYDTDTSLYYCQSRYYDPALGRFLNADAFTSTGQGILGNNMFAYCLNNPICFYDKSGEYADSYAGRIGEELGKLIYEWITGDAYLSQETDSKEWEIAQKQNELIKRGAKALWDASMRGYNIQQEAQRQDDAALLEGAKYFAAHPKKAETILRDMTGVSVAVTTAVSTALAGSPLGVTLGAIAVAGVAVWDVSWTIGEIIVDIQHPEEKGR